MWFGPTNPAVYSDGARHEGLIEEPPISNALNNASVDLKWHLFSIWEAHTHESLVQEGLGEVPRSSNRTQVDQSCDARKGSYCDHKGGMVLSRLPPCVSLNSHGNAH